MASPLPPPVVVCSCSWRRKPTEAPGSVSKGAQCSHDDSDICSACSGSPLVVVKHGTPVPAPPADRVPIEFSAAVTNAGKAAKAPSCELQCMLASLVCVHCDLVSADKPHPCVSCVARPVAEFAPSPDPQSSSRHPRLCKPSQWCLLLATPSFASCVNAVGGVRPHQAWGTRST